MTWAGRSIRRFEDPALLMGRGRFTADLARNAAHVRFVRSPVARGRILDIEIPPGAKVFTAQDLKGVKPIRPVLNRPDYVPVDQPVLADGRVCFMGQAIAAVVAGDAASAEDLAELVFADIDAEDPILDVDAALEPGAELTHPHAAGNVLVEGRIETPGFSAAMAGAPAVVELELRSRRQSAMPLEGRGGVARFDTTSGRVTLYASVQMPHMLRTGIADVLDMPEADLRVVAPDVGGGFGQKMSLFPEYAVLVWLSRHLQCDLAWIEDRRENFLASAHSRDQAFTVRGGFDAEGRCLALEADMRSNVGAFSCYPVTCGVEPLMALAELPGPYKIAEYKARSRGVTTNTCTMAPYRGVARPMLTLTMERLMDVAAKQLGLDPYEIRRRNLVDSFPHRSPTGLVYDEGSYKEAMELALATIDVPQFRTRQQAARAEGRYLGFGISVFSERTGYGTPAYAARGMDIVPGYEEVECMMDPSGFVEVKIGASPHGQGLKTSLAQLVADELGLSPDLIRITAGDTDRTPYGWGTFASRSIVISGGACKLASIKVADKIKLIAAQLMECDSDAIDLEDGLARVRGTNRSMPIAGVARAAYHQSHQFPGQSAGLRESAFYDPPGTFSNACHAAIVEVSPQTGEVRIERFLASEDAGLLINPMIVDGQIHGGIAQGIANALYEELIYDEQGNLLTTSLADYLAPTIREIPTIEILHLQTVTASSVTKAKGVGEGGSIGAPAAVLNAIADALSPFGVMINDMPASPQRIRDLLHAAKEAGHD